MSDGQNEAHDDSRDPSEDVVFMRNHDDLEARLIPGAKALIAELREQVKAAAVQVVKLDTLLEFTKAELQQVVRMRAEFERGWLYRLFTFGGRK